MTCPGPSVNSVRMSHNSTRHGTIVIRQGLLTSDPQQVWQLAVQQAQETAGSQDGPSTSNSGTTRPAEGTDNSTDREVEFTFDVLT